MSENTTTTTNNVNVFAEERDAKLWATARKSARLATTYGLKTTTVLARLAASRVLGGEDVSTLATMVADDADMRAAGVKASSIRAYGAPLKRLAAVLPADVYEALLIGDLSVTVTTADKWARDPEMGSAKVRRAIAGLAIPNRVKLAAAMLAAGAPVVRVPANAGFPLTDAGKSDAGKSDAGKSDADKREDDKSDAGKSADKSADKSAATTYGDALESLVDAAQILLNMTTRGELSDGERRMLMRNISQLHAAFDAACAIAVGK